MDTTVIEKIRGSKIIADMKKNNFLPKRIYVMHLNNCLESFQIKEEYSLDGIIDLKWEKIEDGIYATNSFYREVVVQELSKCMMRELLFEGTLRLWVFE